jgi:hypothetical protein
MSDTPPESVLANLRLFMKLKDVLAAAGFTLLQVSRSTTKDGKVGPIEARLVEGGE